MPKLPLIAFSCPEPPLATGLAPASHGPPAPAGQTVQRAVATGAACPAGLVNRRVKEGVVLTPPASALTAVGAAGAWLSTLNVAVGLLAELPAGSAASTRKVCEP